ncbi:MAG: transposase [Treponema sp.]|nr:transposase [Treponema sp.]
MSGICNEHGDFENIIFSYANFADCKITEKLAVVVKGTIFADAGYLQKKDVLKRMEEDGIKFEDAPNVSALFI